MHVMIRDTSSGFCAGKRRGKSQTKSKRRYLAIIISSVKAMGRHSEIQVWHASCHYDLFAVKQHGPSDSWTVAAEVATGVTIGEEETSTSTKFW
mmetsp:Transcript_50334/g.105074  ORF Transcript_50334/g.105074 Transcript_50334/m.105074 type:complete len:94 (-) Transcript_50334:79-360(-)